MGKLSIEEQANAYSCILACATQMYLSGDADKATLEKLFPDLKQSKDEKIKQELLNQFKRYKSAGIVQYTDDLTIDDVIAWIEKQKNSVNDRSAETVRAEKHKEPKNKPSFRVNDWVIMTKDASRKIMQIKTITDEYYETIDQKGSVGQYPLHQAVDWKQWTIDDAKPGDILACRDNIVMFKSIDKDKGENMQNYCTYYYNGANEFHTNTFTLLLCKSAYLPATAEQCKMLDEQLVGLGYVWDEKHKALHELDLRDVQGVDLGIDGLWHAMSILERTYGDLPEYQFANTSKQDAALNAINAIYQNSQNFSWINKATHYDNGSRLKKMIKDDIDKICQKTGIEINGIYHALKILELTLGTVAGYQSDDGILSHKCAINEIMIIYRYLNE